MGPHLLGGCIRIHFGIRPYVVLAFCFVFVNMGTSETFFIKDFDGCDTAKLRVVVAPNLCLAFDLELSRSLFELFEMYLFALAFGFDS